MAGTGYGQVLTRLPTGSKPAVIYIKGEDVLQDYCWYSKLQILGCNKATKA